MSILCQFPGTARIRASGKLKEELKMFLLLKENGGWEVNKKAVLLTNPLFSMQSAVHYCRDRVCIFSDLPAASSLSETNKTTSERQKEERHASFVVHTIKEHGGARNSSIRESRLYCGGVCCNITADVCFSPCHDSFKVSPSVGWDDANINSL